MEESLYDKIVRLHMEARRARAVHTALFGALLADLRGIMKADKTETVSDEIATKLVSKFLKGVNENLSYRDTPELRAEKAILEGLLPKRLTADDLRTEIADAAAEAGVQVEPKSMGAIMKVLNAAHPGKIDGAEVAAMVRTWNHE